MAEINGEEKRIGVSGEQIEEVVGKMPAVEADVKENKQNISALQTASAQHTADIAKNTADIALKANADEVYSKDETDSAITAKVAEIVAGAPEEFDTLKEMSDWLTEHSDSAATMNTAIQANTKAIADNKADIEANTAEIESNKSDILSAKNDIAINRATLGTQCKNLFNKDGNINILFNGVEVNAPDSINTVDNNVITFNRNSQKEHLSGKVISNLKGKRLIISFNILSFGTGTAGTFRIQKLYDGTALLSKTYGTLGQKTEEFTSDEDALLFVFGISSAPNTGKGLQIENLMIRSADITDDSYEPYKPSLQEQINALVAEIAELKANQTTVSE